MSDNIRRVSGEAPVRTAHMERIPAKDLEGNWSVLLFGVVFCQAERFNLKATDDDHIQLNGCCCIGTVLPFVCCPTGYRLTREEGTNTFSNGGGGEDRQAFTFASADAITNDRVKCKDLTYTKKNPGTTRTFPPCM